MTLERYILSCKQSKMLQSKFSNLDYDPNGYCQYINSLRILAMRYLPQDLLEMLIKQKVSLSPTPYIIIDNLPCDDLVYKTPLASENIRQCKPTTLSESLLLAISSIIGEPYSILFEGEEIVNNLIPSRETSKDFTGLGSEVELDFHIENAALKYMEEYNFSPLGLSLIGVQHDPNGPKTLISDGRIALSNISKEDRAILKQKRFKIKIPYRWRIAMNEQKSSEVIAIIKEDFDYPDLAVAFYGDMIEAMDATAKKALNNFYQQIKKSAVKVDIKPGRLVYIDNRFALHSREAFSPSFDNEGRALRWIQRAFVSSNLWSHRNLIRSKHRVFSPKSIQYSESIAGL